MKKEIKGTCAIYARYSSDSQRDASIEDQIRECKDYAEKANLEVIKEYTDRALSATTDKRPGFLQMIKDSEEGTFNFVICYKTDRFSRNRGDAAKYKRILKENGVKVLYAKMNIPDGPEGIILEGMMETLDEYYSANLSQNIRRGQFGNAQKCMTNGVRIFGYGKDESDHFIIIEDQAKAIKEIFKMVIDGKNDIEIINWLNSNGFRNSLGTPFRKNCIAKMISDRRYLGEYRFGETVIPGGMPAIIDENTFALANESKNKRMVKKVKNTNYILSDVLYCGECGASMSGTCGYSRNKKKYYYYTCLNKKKKICDTVNFNKDLLENAVIDIINGYLFNDEVLNQIIDGVIAYQQKHVDRTHIESLEAHLREINTSLSNILKVVEKGNLNDTLVNRMNELDAEKKEIELAIKQDQINEKMVDPDVLRFMLLQMKTTTDSSYKNKRRLVNTFVNKAYIFKDGRLIITFNYTKNGHLATHEEMLDIMQKNKCSSKAEMVEYFDLKSNIIIAYDQNNFYIISLIS